MEENSTPFPQTKDEWRTSFQWTRVMSGADCRSVTLHFLITWSLSRTLSKNYVILIIIHVRNWNDSFKFHSIISFPPFCSSTFCCSPTHPSRNKKKWFGGMARDVLLRRPCQQVSKYVPKRIPFGGSLDEVEEPGTVCSTGSKTVTRGSYASPNLRRNLTHYSNS